MNGHASVYPSDGPAMEPELLRLMSRIQDANVRLVKFADHVENVADRVFGATPKAVPGNLANGPAPSGTVHMLNVTIDALHARITEAEDSFSRLGNL